MTSNDSFIDANVDGAGSNSEPLGQRKEIKIHQGAITHEMSRSELGTEDDARYFPRLVK